MAWNRVLRSRKSSARDSPIIPQGLFSFAFPFLLCFAIKPPNPRCFFFFWLVCRVQRAHTHSSTIFARSFFNPDPCFSSCAQDSCATAPQSSWESALIFVTRVYHWFKTLFFKPIAPVTADRFAVLLGIRKAHHAAPWCDRANNGPPSVVCFSSPSEKPPNQPACPRGRAITSRMSCLWMTRSPVVPFLWISPLRVTMQILLDHKAPLIFPFASAPPLN